MFFSPYPGPVHDSRVFKNSPLNEHLQKESSGSNDLLGDSANSLSTYLLVSVRDNRHLTPEQMTYNNANSSKSVDTEIRFGPLKVKFRKLKFLDVNKVYLIPNLIVTCCVLHNFILTLKMIFIYRKKKQHLDSTLHQKHKFGRDQA